LHPESVEIPRIVEVMGRSLVLLVLEGYWRLNDRPVELELVEHRVQALLAYQALVPLAVEEMVVQAVLHLTEELVRVPGQLLGAHVEFIAYLFVIEDVLEDLDELHEDAHVA